MLELHERLKQHRINRGITQQQLADLAGVSRYTVILWESGRKPNMPNVLKIARAMNVNVEDLVK